MKFFVLTLALASSACGAAPHADAPREATTSAPAPTTPCVPAPDATAPTYSELYTRYFAPGTPGHCAASHCHGTVGANAWTCGDTPDACYRGMVKVGLIDPGRPAASEIADTNTSPLAWVNPGGDMPFDAATPYAEGRDAIVAWVAACAPNN